jgi:glycosyltransferase involved in cell wall biosynthesis
MEIVVAGYPLLSPRQWRLFEEFEARGVETHIIVPRNWPGIPESDHPPRDAPFEVHALNLRFEDRRGAYYLRGIRDTLTDINPDAALTHAEPWTLFAVQMEMACTVVDVPHAIFSWENLDHVPTSKFQRALERVLNNRVEGMIAGSDRARDRLRTRGFRGPITVAPQSGVDTTVFEPTDSNSELRTEFGIPSDSTLVTYAGRFSRQKGIDSLLDAIPTVVENCHDVAFLLIGDGEMAAEIRERLGGDSTISEHVTLVPEFQPYKRMPKILQSSDIVAYPSVTVDNWAEQFGYVVAEAMACEVPVVTTECGSLPYVVGDGGLVCPEGDTASIASKIISLVSDEGRRTELGKVGRNRVEEKFSLPAVAGRQLDLLKQISKDNSVATY